MRHGDVGGDGIRLLGGEPRAEGENEKNISHLIIVSLTVSPDAPRRRYHLCDATTGERSEIRRREGAVKQ